MATTKEDLSRRIREAVERSGKNRSEIASEAGVHVSSVHKAMSGTSEPGALTLAGIARAVATTPDALLGFDTGQAASLDVPAPPARAVAIGQDVMRLERTERQAIMRIVGALIAARKATAADNPPQAGNPRTSRATKKRERTSKA